MQVPAHSLERGVILIAAQPVKTGFLVIVTAAESTSVTPMRWSGSTERRRSRTYRAVGYTTAPVLALHEERRAWLVQARPCRLWRGARQSARRSRRLLPAAVSGELCRPCETFTPSPRVLNLRAAAVRPPSPTLPAGTSIIEPAARMVLEISCHRRSRPSARVMSRPRTAWTRRFAPGGSRRPSGRRLRDRRPIRSHRPCRFRVQRSLEDG